MRYTRKIPCSSSFQAREEMAEYSDLSSFMAKKIPVLRFLASSYVTNFQSGAWLSCSC